MNYTSHFSSFFWGLDAKSRCGEKVEIPAGDNIFVSTHHLEGYTHVLNQIDESHYILGVVYFERGEMADTQFCITGSPLHNISTREKENLVTASARELAEEAGLFAIEKRSYNNQYDILVDRGRIVSTFGVNANNCVAFDTREHSSMIPRYSGKDWKDNKKKKIQLLVHGTLEEMTMLIETIHNRIRSKDYAAIRGLRIISWHDAQAISQILFPPTT